jgi:hypothetical protein
MGELIQSDGENTNPTNQVRVLIQTKAETFRNIVSACVQ